MNIKFRYDIINSLIKKHDYKKYLEIGIQNPEENFNKIKAEHKVSVEPQPWAPVTFKGTSDEYFNSIDNSVLFDMIFIDGLHYHEQVYKDIQNSLNHLKDGGTIICHDCLPTSEQCQNREIVGEWTGDVWKAIARLRIESTDLEINVVDTDWGCAILRRGTNTPFTYDTNMNPYEYKFFVQHRNKLLNVISPEEFKAKYQIEDEAVQVDEYGFKLNFS